MNADKSIVIKGLRQLDKLGLLAYTPASTSPKLTFLSDRIHHRSVIFSPEHYFNRKKEAIERFESVKSYFTSSSKCRSQILLEYFGETNPRRCGMCDVCEKRNETGLSEYKFNEILKKVKPMLKAGPMLPEELIASFGIMDNEKALAAIRWMMDNGKIVQSKDGKLFWK
jgi:ATP-dependent DNA helicase RecQ